MAKITVKRAGTVEQQLELTGKPVSLGREAGNDLVLADASVSRQHARIEKSSSGFYRIVDLESGNGVVHQGKRVSSLELYPGCEVEIGNLTLKLEDETPVPLLVLVAGAPLRSYPLLSTETVVGRSPELPVAVPDPLVSSQHCKIVRRGNVYALVDLGSENGTRVNGVRVSSKELTQGDQIRVGGFTFFFAFDGVVPDPESIRIVQPVQSPGEPSPPQRAAPPPVAPAAASAAKAPAPSSRGKLLLVGAGGFFILFLLVLVVLLRSPDDAAEREFQEVFQAELSAEESARIEEYLREAREYEQNGNVQMALEQYRKVLVLDATHQHSVAEAARLEELIEMEKAARLERERAEREMQASVATLLERATELLGQSKFAEARTTLDEARAIAPESEVVKAKLVESWVAEGNYYRSRDGNRARQAYDKALELDPGSGDARRGLSGMDQSRRASRDRQQRIDELTETGLAQLQRQEYRQAYASFGEVLKLDPNHARARELREQSSQLLEGQVRPMYDEGVRLYNAGELAPSMAQFQKILAIYPDHADTKAFLAQNAARVRNEAVEIYKKAYIYEGLGRLREALDLYRQTLALLPDPREEYHQKASQRINDLSRKLQ
jgi:pSer/pThr/pTyr-binding forkhead associated (FHA) protein/tetratricopeptide (TPR) repeat protein